MTRATRFVAAGLLAAGLFGGGGSAHAAYCEANELDTNCRMCDRGFCQFCSVHQKVIVQTFEFHVCVPYYEA